MLPGLPKFRLASAVQEGWSKKSKLHAPHDAAWSKSNISPACDMPHDSDLHQRSGLLETSHYVGTTLAQEMHKQGQE